MSSHARPRGLGARAPTGYAEPSTRSESLTVRSLTTAAWGPRRGAPPLLHKQFLPPALAGARPKSAEAAEASRRKPSHTLQ